MVSGQTPQMEWKQNPNGERRTIAEAREIAEQHGVRIPKDYEFFAVDWPDLSNDCVARCPRVDKPSGSIVTWSDLVHQKTGKVPIRVWISILTSDEAIVATFTHELFELEYLRPLLKEGRTTIDSFIEHIRPGNPGNLHDLAWDASDKAVRMMREKEGRE